MEGVLHLGSTYLNVRKLVNFPPKIVCKYVCMYICTHLRSLIFFFRFTNFFIFLPFLERIDPRNFKRQQSITFPWNSMQVVISKMEQDPLGMPWCVTQNPVLATVMTALILVAHEPLKDDSSSWLYQVLEGFEGDRKKTISLVNKWKP